MQYLCQAFDADPAQPAVLIMLARLCINRNDPERARALALAAQRVASTPEARAHATVLLARAEHALSNFKEAYNAYQQVSTTRLSMLDSQAREVTRVPALACHQCLFLWWCGCCKCVDCAFLI